MRINIGAEKIPQYEVESLARVANRAITKFYEDPDNQRKFEEWLASDRAKELRAQMKNPW